MPTLSGAVTPIVIADPTRPQALFDRNVHVESLGFPAESLPLHPVEVPMCEGNYAPGSPIVANDHYFLAGVKSSKTGRAAVLVLYCDGKPREQAYRHLLLPGHATPLSISLHPLHPSLAAIASTTGSFSVYELETLQHIFHFNLAFPFPCFSAVSFAPSLEVRLLLAADMRVELWELGPALEYHTSPPAAGPSPFVLAGNEPRAALEKLLTVHHVNRDEHAPPTCIAAGSVTDSSATTVYYAVGYADGHACIYEDSPVGPVTLQLIVPLVASPLSSLHFCTARPSHLPSGPAVACAQTLLAVAWQDTHGPSIALHDVLSGTLVQRVSVSGGPSHVVVLGGGAHLLVVEEATGVVYAFALQSPPAATPGQPRDFRFARLVSVSVGRLGQQPVIKAAALADAQAEAKLVVMSATLMNRYKLELQPVPEGVWPSPPATDEDVAATIGAEADVISPEEVVGGEVEVPAGDTIPLASSPAVAVLPAIDDGVVEAPTDAKHEAAVVPGAGPSAPGGEAEVPTLNPTLVGGGEQPAVAMPLFSANSLEGSGFPNTAVPNLAVPVFGGAGTHLSSVLPAPSDVSALLAAAAASNPIPSLTSSTSVALPAAIAPSGAEHSAPLAGLSSNPATSAAAAGSTLFAPPVSSSFSTPLVIPAATNVTLPVQPVAPLPPFEPLSAPPPFQPVAPLPPFQPLAPLAPIPSANCAAAAAAAPAAAAAAASSPVSNGTLQELMALVRQQQKALDALNTTIARQDVQLRAVIEERDKASQAAVRTQFTKLAADLRKEDERIRKEILAEDTEKHARLLATIADTLNGPFLERISAAVHDGQTRAAAAAAPAAAMTQAMTQGITQAVATRVEAVVAEALPRLLATPAVAQKASEIFNQMLPPLLRAQAETIARGVVEKVLGAIEAAVNRMLTQIAATSETSTNALAADTRAALASTLTGVVAAEVRGTLLAGLAGEVRAAIATAGPQAQDLRAVQDQLGGVIERATARIIQEIAARAPPAAPPPTPLPPPAPSTEDLIRAREIGPALEQVLNKRSMPELVAALRLLVAVHGNPEPVFTETILNLNVLASLVLQLINAIEQDSDIKLLTLHSLMPSINRLQPPQRLALYTEIQKRLSPVAIANQFYYAIMGACMRETAALGGAQ